MLLPMPSPGPFGLHTSGDLIADRRYAYGMDLLRDGDAAAAIDLFEQALERAPGWPPAWFALARARRDHFDPAGAAAAFRECLRIDPADRLGAGLELARIDSAVALDAAPPAYVEALFNAYAADFDQALVERLDYCAPTALADLVRQHAPDAAPHRFARVLDLGCGTGLAGEALRRDAAYLEGVDLADAMIDRATEKGVYDALARREILAHLMDARDRYDLIIAADVFSYLGALDRIFAAARERLAPGGLFAFTVERGEAADWRVRASLRFAHSEDYIRRLAAATGLEVCGLEARPLRKDRGADVIGLLAVMRAPATDAAGTYTDAIAAAALRLGDPAH